jgi:hypothetical protein
MPHPEDILRIEQTAAALRMRVTYVRRTTTQRWHGTTALLSWQPRHVETPLHRPINESGAQHCSRSATTRCNSSTHQSSPPLPRTPRFDLEPAFILSPSMLQACERCSQQQSAPDLGGRGVALTPPWPPAPE